jgi:opacity protein-like surface antigen
MRRTIAFMTWGALAVLPSASFAGNLDVRLGAFFPNADSVLFHDDAVLYQKDGRPLETSDWIGLAGGVSYNARIARNIELGFALDGYGRTVHTSYRDYVTETGREINQSLKLSIVPLGVSLRFVPTSRRARIAPFILVGGDFIFYTYEEFGDFIDFDVPDTPVISDSFRSEGFQPGFHVGGGLRVSVSDDIGLVGEYRYQYAKDDMGDDFIGNRIDLSGSMVTLGVNIRF